MSISTFTPPKEFLDLVETHTAVAQWPRNSADKSVFLITGVVVATSVKFTSLTGQEKECEGILGIGGHGMKFGSSGSKSRKTTLDVSHTDDGPVVLAYRVQKLLLSEAGKVSAKSYTDGAYFGDVDALMLEVKLDDLDEYDVADFDKVEVIDEIDGKECSLYFHVQ